jgi:Lipid A 3-O-deacylase (PagL)
MTRLTTLGAVLVALLAWALPAWAYDARETFMQGSIVLSPEVSYGHQFDLEHKPGYTGVEYVNAGVRLGYLPLPPLAAGTPVHGALELGLEPLYQQYTFPELVYFAGLGLTVRYHFLGLGRLVPYAEVAAFAGATNLKITEIRSTFTFVVWAGLGASYFVTDRTAIYAGYRYEHISNGNTSRPNRGLETDAGVLGVSFFFE